MVPGELSLPKRVRFRRAAIGKLRAAVEGVGQPLDRAEDADLVAVAGTRDHVREHTGRVGLDRGFVAALG